MKVSQLKPGQRFFYGMWYDFVSSELVASCYHVWVTNGYDNNEFLVVIHQNDTVQLSRKDSLLTAE